MSPEARFLNVPMPYFKIKIFPIEKHVLGALTGPFCFLADNSLYSFQNLLTLQLEWKQDSFRGAFS